MARTIRSCTLNSLLHNPDRPQGKPADQLMAGGSIPVSTSGSIPGSAKGQKCVKLPIVATQSIATRCVKFASNVTGTYSELNVNWWP